MKEELSSIPGPLVKAPDSPEKMPGEPMRLRVNGKEEILDSKVFLERFGVTKWVRFQEEDFKANFGTVAHGQEIDHLNYKHPNHEAGKTYLVMMIVDEPDRPKGALPLLTLEGAFIVECIEMTHPIQDDPQDRYFEHPLLGINKESFLNVVKERYDVTDAEIAERGIAHTRFRVIKTPEEVKAMSERPQL